MSRPPVALIFIICLLASPLGAETPPESLDHRDLPIEEVFEAFRNPAAEARPFVRWWWNHNQVEEGEILRELDVLKAAGIGGVEINPIKGKEPSEQSKAKVLTWRSPEWDRVLLAACKGAKERDMIVDLIAGSGWPFGGKFLKPDQQIQRLTVRNQTVQGGGPLRLPLGEWIGKESADLVFVKVWPRSIAAIGEVRDVTDRVGEDQVLEIELAGGEHVVSCGIVSTGFCEVTFGVPGADGPTMDHMQKEVTRLYLDRLRGVEESWGEPLGNYVRAIFCDSIETMGANWTRGITDSFRERKGYDISPWLPLVLGGDVAGISPEMRDGVLRARYDWSEHVVSVFLDNFTAEYAAFCHEHGLLSRYQAYGLPHLMGMAEGYMIPDIPESNNWLYSQGMIDPMDPAEFTWNQKHGYMIWNKYAAAAGRMRGRKVISCEAMTNTGKVFHLTLASVKQADDMNFITGITHSVLHGYNYSPPDVSFPGWIRFGAYFNERNSWWSHFPRWADYNARLSTMFQETRPVAEVAILGRTADHWSATGLERDPIHLEPGYLHRLWEPLSRLGIGSDYLHEAVIQGAQTKGGRLRIGPMAYKLLIVADAESLQPATAEAIRRFAESGGKVVFTGRAPHRAPGLADSEENDARVRDAIEKAIGAGALNADAPAAGAGSEDLRVWTDDVLDRIAFPRTLSIQSPNSALYSLRHRAPDADVIFLANTHRRQSVKSRVGFSLGQKGLWRWDPETGERAAYELPHDREGFQIDLHPLESVLLVTGGKREGDPGENPGEAPTPVSITTPWEVTFHPVQSDESFELSMPSLEDFTASEDPKVRTFAGTAVYRTTFDAEHTHFTSLSLGRDNDFISEVELNGRKLGVVWYGPLPLNLRNALRTGENQLTIRYTTTLWNAMGKDELQPSGLLGPVTLR
jgi:hypothetical protein